MFRLLTLLLACSGLFAATPPVIEKAAGVGLSAETLEAAAAVYRHAVEADEVRGGVMLVARNGKVVLHEAFGWRDEARTKPYEKDTLFRMASNTKPVVATGILLLEQDRMLELNDLVRKHLEGWDNYRSGFIQVRHLLSHTSGLRIRPIFLDAMASDTTLAKEAARFGAIGAEEVVGLTYSYNNPGFNTLGALIEELSGQKLDAYLQTEVYEPLGMTDSSNYEADADPDRMATVMRKDDGEWSASWTPGDGPDYPIVRASGGMISTTADYLRFLEMWRQGGKLDGVRLLSEENVERAWTAQPNTEHEADGVERRYGLGWFSYPNGGWGHGGSDGTNAVVYPDEGLVILGFTQTQGAGKTWQRFVELVRAAVE